MIKNLHIKTTIFIGLLAITNQAFAQLDAAGFLKTGKDEANKLIGGYLSPINKGFASGANDAWYSTAKPLGLGGFDIKFGLGGSFVNDNAKSFTLNSIGISTDQKSPFLINAVGGDGNTKQPTIVGDGMSSSFAVSTANPIDNSLPRIYVDTIAAFKGTGSFVSSGTLPFVQASFGLIKGTEIMVRLSPFQVGDFKSSGFGFGVKHSITQWIWGVDKLPLDVSAIYTYNTNSLELSFGDKFLDANRNLPNALTIDEYRNSQKLTINNSGYQLGLIVSKKLLVFTPYLGLTYHSASSEIAMKGIYPVQSVRQTSAVTYEQYNENLKDPISTTTNTLTAFKATLGFRFKFTVITFGAEYNQSFSDNQFSTFNGIFAINLQQIAPIFKL